MVNLELTNKEYRMLLDLVYTGNWVLNSIRDEDRFEDYDDLEEKIFSLSRTCGMGVVSEWYEGHIVPSQAYEEGGIHEAIAEYEDSIFFDILAEEMARRDMEEASMSPDDNYEDLSRRMEYYLSEFERSGIDHLRVDSSV